MKRYAKSVVFYPYENPVNLRHILDPSGSPGQAIRMKVIFLASSKSGEYVDINESRSDFVQLGPLGPLMLLMSCHAFNTLQALHLCVLHPNTFFVMLSCGPWELLESTAPRRGQDSAPPRLLHAAPLPHLTRRQFSLVNAPDPVQEAVAAADLNATWEYIEAANVAEIAW